MLRPYQQAGLDKVLSRKDKRLLFMWATSAGKTLATIKLAESLNAKNILITVPAMGRGTWLAEFAKWAPSFEPMAIRVGKERVSGLSKAVKAYRDSAYQANIVVSSYRLVEQLEPRKWDLICCDESHALRDPLSQQSKALRNHFKASPQAASLGLSATAIPTDPKQIWNILDMFWPMQWGPQQPSGDISWKFQAMYCEKIQNEYGTSYKGARDPEAIESLSRRLDPFVHRVSDSEVAPFLPPLHAEALRLDEKIEPIRLAPEWLEGLPSGAIPILICFLRETAQKLGKVLGCGVIDGTIQPEKRIEILRKAALAGLPIVATSESIRESISLSVFTHALVFEWRTSPGQAIQLIGRFARQDAADLKRPTYVQYVCQPGDDSRADLLQERIQVVQEIQQKDSKGEKLVELFKPEPLTDERAESMFAAMIGNIRTVNTDEDEPEYADAV